METKPQSSFYLLVVLFSLFACSETENPLAPDPIEGLEPEAIIYLNDRPWFPATIGMVIIDTDITGLIRIAANTSGNKGFRRELTVEVIDENLRVPDNGRMNYWEVVFPIIANTTYKEYKNAGNTESDEWRSFYNNWAGIRLDSIYTIDEITYATGEFFATPGNDSLVPSRQDITGLFDRVRVFGSPSEMRVYYDRVTERERFED